MIIEYHRPSTLDEALALLASGTVKTVPLGGGTSLNQPSAEAFSVVDLQALGLDQLEKRGSNLSIGAMVTLQALLEGGQAPPVLRRAIHHEAGYNLRQVASVAGALVAASGRSTFATVMLALDASLDLRAAGQPAQTVSLGDLLPVRGERLGGRLITGVTIPLNVRLAYEVVARTPADLPIVCVALARWPSGRVRVALGGYGAAPVLAFDGPEPGGVEQAARIAYSHADDEWASAEYRQDMASVLARRCLSRIES